MFGGVSDYAYYLSISLAKKGYEVYVMTSCDDRVIRSSFEDNLKVLPLVSNWGIKGLSQIIKEIKKINPDRIILQFVPHMYSYYGIPIYIALLSITIRVMRFRLITTFHELGIGFEFKRPKYWGIAILQKLIAYTLCIVSDKVVVSIESDRKILGFFDKKVYRVPIGSNILPLAIPDDEKKELREKISSSQEIIISTFGSNPRRNDLLIKVVRRLRDKNIRVKLLVIGKFPDNWIKMMRIKAKELKIEDAIYFTGFVGSEDAYRYLSVSDVFVILENIYSRGWGGVSTKSTSLASAFAAGLPIIGNKGGMTDDFFNHRDNIILVDSLDEEIISEEVIKLISDPVLMKDLKNGAIKTFETKLSWPVIAESYIQLF